MTGPLLIAALAVNGYAQQFEAASVRPAAPISRAQPQYTRGGPGTSDPGQIIYRGSTLGQLVLAAYDIPFYRLAGPASLVGRRYDIVAKIPAGASDAAFRSMLQNLLTARIGLEFHRRPTAFDSYRLVAGPRGPKLKTTAIASDDGSLHRDAEGIVTAPGVITTQWQDGRVILSGGRVPMQKLAAYLEQQLRSPVMEATGLTGAYDLRMQFSPEGLRLQPSQQLLANPVSGQASEPGPNIFQALEQQLGLKLEKSKELLDVLVVDHVNEVPTDN